MYKLPLFPLNTVLFPTTPIRLHIFEERYRLMIGRCLERNEPFGIVALQRGAEVEGFGIATEPHVIGCTATITEHQKLYDGRMNIVAVGQERFKIVSLDRSEPYLQANVEQFPFESSTSGDLAQAGMRLRPWVERYFRLLGRAENIELDTQKIPADPVELAFLSASVLRLPVAEKQDLLRIPSIIDLISELYPYYRKEATLLHLLLAPDRVREEGPFSLN